MRVLQLGLIALIVVAFTTAGAPSIVDAWHQIRLPAEHIETAGAPTLIASSPMSPWASREDQKQAGLFNTGVVPVYPEDASCLQVNSFFGDTTRYDGSRRNPRANHGYHAGFDISAAEGTPVVAIADDEVVHKYSGGMLVGHQIFLRHTPDDTGLPVWIYSKYKHFQELPELEIGERVEMGQVIGRSGKTGTVGGYFRQRGYPHLHLSIYVSGSGRYNTVERAAIPEDVRHLDPAAIYLMKSMNVFDNHAVKELREDQKTVRVSYKMMDGRFIPADTRLIWPFMCSPR